MDIIKKFVDASGNAVNMFLSRMSAEDQARLAALFEAGNALAMSHVVHPDGSSAVMFEVVLSDGSRRVLASICGEVPTVQ